jgi:Mg-chelatase subunit ChlD
MLRPAGDGGTKLAAVLRAARAFLARFGPGPDSGRVALVGFNETAWIAESLTGDAARLEAALERLPERMAEGTRLDLGLAEGRAALGPAQTGRVRAMVFLTDGLPNRVPTPVAGGSQEDTVLAVAAAARADGIQIHTVGYGRADAPDLADRILPSLLVAMAGSPAAYHETDDAGALAEVFRRLAVVVGCFRQVGWP